MAGPDRRRPATRGLAVRVLRDIERRRGFSNRILSEHLERVPDLAARDRGLVTHLVYGVLRHRARIDHHIDAHARKPDALDGRVREILRVGVLELLELGHPPHAAIAEAAAQVQALQGGPRLRGLVHAILSRVHEHGARVDAQAEVLPAVEAAYARWSIPRWIGERWVEELGAETTLARARALSVVPPLDLRVDLSRTDRPAVLEELARDHPHARVTAPEEHPQAIRMHGGGDVFHGPLASRGLVAVQGLGAQQAAIALAPVAGMRVLDACAGLGVKTIQLAELMRRRGTIVAVDASAVRHEELQQAATRLRGEELSTRSLVADLTGDIPDIDDAPFDAVLLDVPCTGLGNLARHPEIRWFREPADLPARAELQSRLLARCMARVRPGGRLAYAVCSFAPEEGPQVVHAVAKDLGSRVLHERTTTPEGDATEGFYVAVLSG